MATTQNYTDDAMTRLEQLRRRCCFVVSHEFFFTIIPQFYYYCSIHNNIFSVSPSYHHRYTYILIQSNSIHSQNFHSISIQPVAIKLKENLTGNKNNILIRKYELKGMQSRY